ncbi:hypothetical protein B9G69_013485 [Bdellovibrio sp. SKB1291214]|uniref:hypothetical protein n=1 Tax=Bdellovibrio sp. SKB1291214 TaxID=1732569 RepID=UPI000B516DB1|nr:hypothetical protein [Bdellovibrio sp. SKB1291214]UYL08057.1 hypothetical protein B9G69_013485 [Bdellovibrio sp. SKB1291214]
MMNMEMEILTFLSVVMFCFCCRQLIHAVVAPIPLLANQRPYAFRAMQLGKGYKVMAWALMTSVFMVGTTVSFYQVFTTL